MAIRMIVLLMVLSSTLCARDIVLTGKPSDKAAMEAVASEINNRPDQLMKCTISAEASPSTSMQLFYCGRGIKLTSVSTKVVDSLVASIDADREKPKSSTGFLAFALIFVLLVTVPMMMIKRMRNNAKLAQEDAKHAKEQNKSAR